jgi:AcrR family transcriptional regulator
MHKVSLSSESGQRGPVDHERRDQIIRAADEHFRRYGYNKTTVGDLAKAIGVSSAYVYRFFDSKQAIGEAVCAMTLGRIDDQLRHTSIAPKSATDRMRALFHCLLDQGVELFLSERKLHDIVVAAVEGNWSSILVHRAVILDAVRRVVADGRASGEFERKTPLDEIGQAIVATMELFANPGLLEQKEQSELEARVVAVSNLVLRSLAP